MTAQRRMTVPEFRALKAAGIKAVVVTAYDASAATIAETAGVDAILVGDSLGMVIQGLADPLRVTLNQIAYHTACVARGAPRSLIIADMPFMTYQVSPRQAVRNAGKLIRAGAHAVKLEGGERMAEAIAACTRADIAVMGHVGLTPQSVRAVGGFKVQRDLPKIVADAKAVEQAGAFAMVIECVPDSVGAAVTASVNVPTIGIGAGLSCDGQVLVWHDLLGLYGAFKPKFAKQYADLGGQAKVALQEFAKDVRAGLFPGPEHSMI